MLTGGFQKHCLEVRAIVALVGESGRGVSVKGLRFLARALQLPYGWCKFEFLYVRLQSKTQQFLLAAFCVSVEGIRVLVQPVMIYIELGAPRAQGVALARHSARQDAGCRGVSQNGVCAKMGKKI